MIATHPVLGLLLQGIYTIWPLPEELAGKRAATRLSPHVDFHAGLLSAMVLASDVRPQSGGFTLWPGSHRRMHTAFETTMGNVLAGAEGGAPQVWSDRARELVRAIRRDTALVEFVGRAGDVVFWHARLVHSAGINWSGVRWRRHCELA